MNDKTKVLIVLGVLLALDFMVIGGILWKGQANFPELIKHLRQ